MDIRSEILKENSKAQSLKIADWIGNDKNRFGELLRLFLQDEHYVVQRAAWIVSIIAHTQPQLIEPHIEAIVNKMYEPGIPIAVKRNVVRILQLIPIPENMHGRVMNTCFKFLADPKETIAVRVFSMTVLANFTRRYPDIRPELKMVIDHVLEHGASAAFKARLRNLKL